MKGDLEDYVRAWSNGLRQLHLENCVVVRVVVVRLDELQTLREVALSYYLERFHFDGAEMFCVPAGLGTRPARPVQAHLAHEGGGGLKGVQIKVERKSVQGPASEVVISQGFRRINRFVDGIESRLNLISHHARGERLTRMLLVPDSNRGSRLAPRAYHHNPGQNQTKQHQPMAKGALSAFDPRLLDSLEYGVKHQFPPLALGEA